MTGRSTLWVTPRGTRARAATTGSAPGRVAARSMGVSPAPRPPLLTRASRSVRSGNWYANCRHSTPEAVADERGARKVHRDQEVAQGGRMSPERVVPGGRAGVAMPGQIGRDHEVGLGESSDEMLPGAAGTTQTVDQQERLTRAGGAVGDPPAGERDHLVGARGRRAPTSAPAGSRPPK